MVKFAVRLGNLYKLEEGTENDSNNEKSEDYDREHTKRLNLSNLDL